MLIMLNMMTITCGWNVWMFSAARIGLMMRLVRVTARRVSRGGSLILPCLTAANPIRQLVKVLDFTEYFYQY